MFFLGGLIIGIPMIAIWFFMRKQAKASLQWPSVQGMVVNSELIQKRDSDGDETTEASVIYSYAVGGAPLQASRVAIGSRNARATVQKYPAGSAVQVFYDPAKPGSAVLEPGGSGLTLLLVIAIFVMIVAAGIGFIKDSNPSSPSTSQRYSAAMELYKQGKFAEAKPAFEDLARGGSAESEVYVGVMYAKGQGVPQDYVEALKWFILAGDPGKKDREAMEKGMTPVQQQEAEARAAAWKAK